MPDPTNLQILSDLIREGAAKDSAHTITLHGLSARVQALEASDRDLAAKIATLESSVREHTAVRRAELSNRKAAISAAGKLVENRWVERLLILAVIAAAAKCGIQATHLYPSPVSPPAEAGTTNGSTHAYP